MTVRIIVWNLAALLALAPLPLGANRPAAWALLALWLAALLLMWSWGAWRQPAQLVGLGWHRMRVPAILFAIVCAWAALQALPVMPAALEHPLWAGARAALGRDVGGTISAAPDATWAALARLMAYGGAFWLAAELCRDHKRARRLCWAVVVAGIVYAAYGLYVEFTGGGRILWLRKWAYEDSLTSTFVNRNNYATYAGIGLVATLAMLRANVLAWQDRRDDWFLFRAGALMAGALVIATALFLTESRGGLLAALCGIGVLMVTGLADRQRRPGTTRAFAIIAGAAVLVVALLSGSGVVQRFTDRDPGVQDNQRPLIWRQTLAGIAARPVLGHGLGAFEQSFPAYQAPAQITAYRVDKAHNTYLETAYELGVPMALILLAIPALILALCANAIGRRNQDALMPAVALATGTVVGVHALADFSIQIPAIALTWAALLGAGFAQALPARGTPQRKPA
jgi:O-antigen ligase